MLSGKDRDDFLYEARYANSIVTGGGSGKIYCASRCRFCYVNGDGLKYSTKLPYIDEADTMEALKALENTCGPITVGDGNTRLSSEAFSNPRIYSILSLINDWANATHRIFYTYTSGILIRDNMINIISRYPRYYLILTAGSLDIESRKLMYHNWDTRTRIVNTIKAFTERVSVALYPVGGFDAFKRDVDIIRVLDPSIGTIKDGPILLVKPLEYSNYHDSHVKYLNELSRKDYMKCVEYLSKTVPYFYYEYPSVDIALEYGINVEPILEYEIKVKASLQQQQGKSLFMCSEKSYSFWNRVLSDYNCEVVNTRNISLGGSVTCAGLLVYCDIENALKPYWAKLREFNNIYLPSVMFNATGHDLSGVHKSNYAENTGLNLVVI